MKWAFFVNSNCFISTISGVKNDLLNTAFANQCDTLKHVLKDNVIFYVFLALENKNQHTKKN